jgi:hypothetical protein
MSRINLTKEELKSALELLTKAVDVMRRSDPDYVQSHRGAPFNCERTTDEEWDNTLTDMEDFLYDLEEITAEDTAAYTEAFQCGQRASGDGREENPYDDETEPELHDAWDQGFEQGEDEAADDYAASFDSSMRDTHGIPGKDL